MGLLPPKRGPWHKAVGGRATIQKNVLAWTLAFSLATPGCAAVLRSGTDLVTFDSEPAGAEVLVDGKLIGRTPMNASLIAKQDHYIEFVLAGYEREVRAIASSTGSGWVMLDIVPGFILLFMPLLVDAVFDSWKGLDEDSVRVKLRSLAAPQAIVASPRPAPSPVLTPAPSPGVPATKGPVVAVFDVEDSAGLLKANEAGQLTEYLAARVAVVAGFRIVPRAQLRASLAETKSAGYESCFDEACQIELGRALAAEKSLSTKLLRVGSACAIVVSLFDLRTETAEKAATVRTECSEAALLSAVDQVAAELAPR